MSSRRAHGGGPGLDPGPSQAAAQMDTTSTATSSDRREVVRASGTRTVRKARTPSSRWRLQRRTILRLRAPLRPRRVPASPTMTRGFRRDKTLPSRGRPARCRPRQVWPASSAAHTVSTEVSIPHSVQTVGPELEKGQCLPRLHSSPPALVKPPAVGLDQPASNDDHQKAARGRQAPLHRVATQSRARRIQQSQAPSPSSLAHYAEDSRTQSPDRKPGQTGIPSFSSSSSSFRDHQDPHRGQGGQGLHGRDERRRDIEQNGQRQGRPPSDGRGDAGPALRPIPSQVPEVVEDLDGGHHQDRTQDLQGAGKAGPESHRHQDLAPGRQARG